MILHSSSWGCLSTNLIGETNIVKQKNLQWHRIPMISMNFGITMTKKGSIYLFCTSKIQDFSFNNFISALAVHLAMISIIFNMFLKWSKDSEQYDGKFNLEFLNVPTIRILT